jgi:hypothetical protein
MSQTPDYVMLCVLARLAKMSRRQVSVASTYMCMPSLGGKFLPVNASNPSSKWMVRYAISSSRNPKPSWKKREQQALAHLYVVPSYSQVPPLA